MKVAYADSTHRIPFPDDTFDLVLNRHGAMNVKEIARILRKGGLFLTQQVDAKKNLVDLIKEFGGKSKWTFNNLSYRKNELRKEGFEILRSGEWEGEIVFKDVGAVVYFLKSTPWLVDKFSVKSHLKHLERLQDKLDRRGKITFTLANFMMLAKKV